GADVDCSHGPAGRSAETGHRPVATAEILFNESQSRIVISVAPENREKTISMLRKRDIPFQQLGNVGGDELRIRVKEEDFRWPIVDLYDDWWNAIRRAVESDSSPERGGVDLLRTFRTATSRAGERRHRDQFRTGPDLSPTQGHGTGVAGFRAGGAGKIERHARDRPYALFHDRDEHDQECATIRG